MDIRREANADDEIIGRLCDRAQLRCMERHTLDVFWCYRCPKTCAAGEQLIADYESAKDLTGKDG